MAAAADGTDLEASLLSFEKLDRASPDLWPEQLPGVAEFAASFKSPITSSPPKWMAELENDDIDMLKELGSLTTANLMEKVRGLQNLAYQLGLDESMPFLPLLWCLAIQESLVRASHHRNIKTDACYVHIPEYTPTRLPKTCKCIGNHQRFFLLFSAWISLSPCLRFLPLLCTLELNSTCRTGGQITSGEAYCRRDQGPTCLLFSSTGTGRVSFTPVLLGLSCGRLRWASPKKSMCRVLHFS
ncbi:protein lin-52 homolog isoform X2 [Colius striatus]|uniref:protein lin-52 homolog isoform X2 n=1 Tax=Colius striatus TaxID=57412 RepID=UPI002B1DD3B6|nr:protein lin-52 homolog isoform X2 [Colius striatus]